MSLRTKIVVPFLVLFGVEFAVVALLSASIAGQSVERSMRRESEDLARALGQASFVPSRGVLGKIKEIVDIDLARLGPRAAELVSTLAADDEKRLGDELARHLGAGPSGPPSAPGELAVELGGGRYKVFFSPIKAPPGSDEGGLLMLLMPEERVAAAKSALLRPILLTAGAGALPVAILGVWLALAITRPLGQLARAASRIAAGELGERVDPSGGGEIAELARSFNAMAEQLNSREDELLRSERLAVSGRLAAGVAHEIRNPLTAVRMTLQRAERDGGASLDAETAKVLLTEIQRVEMIVDGLVAYARPGPPEFADVDLCELVGEVTRLMQRQFEHAHVELALDVPEGGLGVRADASKLKQVVMNLILNGVKAMPGGGRLSIRAAAETGGAVLEVSDEGQGVPEEVRDSVFEPFVSAREGGTGLGLAISKQIVEEHSGAIAFDTSDAGTTFRVVLPRGEVLG